MSRWLWITKNFHSPWKLYAFPVRSRVWITIVRRLEETRRIEEKKGLNRHAKWKHGTRRNVGILFHLGILPMLRRLHSRLDFQPLAYGHLRASSFKKVSRVSYEISGFSDGTFAVKLCRELQIYPWEHCELESSFFFFLNNLLSKNWLVTKVYL